jgi:DNA-binding response OmpR family regulator
VSGKEHILVVEDDPFVQKSVKAYLTKEDYRVSLAKDGEEMRQVLARGPVDLVIMDLKLPGEDGLQLTRFLRENYAVGIIMLTAKKEVVDRVVGLEIGADDYVTKPWDERELLARIHSVLRRTKGGPGEGPARPGAGQLVHAVVRFQGWEFDLDARRLAAADGEPTPLTTAEFNMLAEFVANPGRVLTRDHLLSAVYKREWEPFDRSIDVLVTRLRRKLEKDPKQPELIKTVRGAGYVFAAPVERRPPAKG